MTQASSDRTVKLADGGQMPLVGFGTWQIRGRRGYDAVRSALAVGYRHIDTATFYANEAEVGQAVRDSGVPREDIFITTKLPPDHAGRERATIEASLRALGTPYVDLWLIHWPPRRGTSPKLWRELLAAKRGGLARSVGVSNYGTDALDELTEATGEAPVVNQIRWSPSLYDAERQAEHRARGIVLEGYSPFKSTNLRHPVLTGIAADHDVTAAQVVMRWHIQHEVVAIPKSATPDRIATNFDVFGFELSPQEMGRIDGMAR
ncbi:MAG TPA: aldo/keto reductase [Micromonosporaceae bacterium]|jgi:diketogulonate reductase-like aldo/keto reductase|nr:aldo/keto reductase [Micromonosporaceae bacterium]